MVLARPSRTWPRTRPAVCGVNVTTSFCLTGVAGLLFEPHDTDTLAAQERVREAIREVGFALMIATALHSIATGNLLPAWVKVVCVDINPATVIKLGDRGTFQCGRDRTRRCAPERGTELCNIPPGGIVK